MGKKKTGPEAGNQTFHHQPQLLFPERTSGPDVDVHGDDTKVMPSSRNLPYENQKK